MQSSIKIFCKNCKAFTQDFQSELVKGHTPDLLIIPDYLLSVYELESAIGTGGFGVVFKALHKLDGDYVALKLLSLSGPNCSEQDIKENMKSLSNEIKINAKMCNEFIIKYITSLPFVPEKWQQLSWKSPTRAFGTW